MRTIYFNGKFSAQATTGVQRVATQMLQALDRLLGSCPPNRRWVLLQPRGAREQGLAHIESRSIGLAGLPLHLWEQCVLPLHARAGLLVNLSGSAPFQGRGQVCTFHDAAVFDHPEAYTLAFVAWYRLLFRRQAAAASLLLTPSAFSRQRLQHWLPAARDRIVVIPNGGDHLSAVTADEALLDRLDLRGRRYLLAVGSANPTKNLGRLVAAFSSLAEPGLRLVIVGGGNPGVFADGGPAHADPRVIRTGPLTDGPLKALYQHALALVFPSLYEGFGLPPLEAMGCGCPVAAARAAAIPEVCGDAAWYFDPTQVEAIAKALRSLLDDAPLRQRLATVGQQRAAGMCWDVTATGLRAQLESTA